MRDHDTTASGPFLSMGGPVDDFTATLRVFGDDLDPDEVTRALGVPPTASHRKGELHEPAPGRAYPRKHGSWRLASARDAPSLEAAVAGLLDILTPDLARWRDLTSRFTVDVFCGVFLRESNRGFELSPALARALADRHLTIGIDIYGPTVYLGTGNRPDLGLLLGGDTLPPDVLIRAVAVRELSEGDDVDSDVWVAAAAAVLADIGLFRDAARKSWARDYEAHRHRRVQAAPSIERSITRLAKGARTIVLQASPALRPELAQRVASYERTTLRTLKTGARPSRRTR